MKGFIKIPLILILLLGLIITAFLYVTRAQQVTQIQDASDKGESIIDSAENQQRETNSDAIKRAQDVQNQLNR